MKQTTLKTNSTIRMTRVILTLPNHLISLNQLKTGILQ